MKENEINNIKSFTLYNEMFRLIDRLEPIEKRNDFLGQILDFYYKEKKPKFEPNSLEETIWLNISKPLISYKTKVVNGSKGGRPKKTEAKSKDKSEDESESKTTSDVNVNVYVYIENNIGITISGSNYEKIQKWLEIFPEDVIKYAVDICVASNKISLNYVFGILNSWEAKGFKTLKDVKKEKKQSKKAETDLPEWWDKEFKEERSDEERAKIEAIRNGTYRA